MWTSNIGISLYCQLIFFFVCETAYACPSKDISRTSSNTKTLEGSDTESFEEVSESDLQELAAHKSALSNGSDTLTTVSLTSLQSKPEADQAVDNNGMECLLLLISYFLCLSHGGFNVAWKYYMFGQRIIASSVSPYILLNSGDGQWSRFVLRVFIHSITYLQTKKHDCFFVSDIFYTFCIYI
jgi:hypothetical protein